jgi:acetoacetyl-CoA reductase/3-oxoacyl-[acyl-carrier protein] reductase
VTLSIHVISDEGVAFMGVANSAAPKLAGKTAVITGAGRGIGRAAALCLAAEGADIVLLERERSSLLETSGEIERLGRRALPLEVNCTDEKEVERAFAEARARTGSLDILVNNVGQSARERASEFCQSNSEVWRFVLDVSLFSTLLCSRQVAPEMRRRGSGKIVNISSHVAFTGDVGAADYAAAKAGMLGFTRSLARELAPHGVNVNAICPGVVETRILDLLSKEAIEELRQAVPMRRFAQPEEIGRVVEFLASSDSDFITGQSIIIDGGQWMI